MRGSDQALLRTGIVIGAAVGVIAVSFGVLARAAGISPLMTMLMSLGIFAGGSQFALVAVVKTGGAIATGVVAALLLNARHLPFGLAIARFLPAGRLTRVASAVLVIDESTAFALAQPDPQRSRRAFYSVGLCIFVSWQTGTPPG